MYSLLVLLFGTANAHLDFTMHGDTFVALLTCYEHSLDFDDNKKEQFYKIAMDLSDASKLLSPNGDMGFAEGMTLQQESQVLLVDKVKSNVYATLDAQVTAYMTKDICLHYEAKGLVLLKHLTETKSTVYDKN